ncbi:Splicing factor 3B subunit 3 [Liparis tanakae]|uniref:Splicing factor 3B subunit 3 n=1 Tax=Liparis tanakae TaxID=230148 RepID=A0A4Z2HZ40_9TELE|nr:Splicing factor 3B subunit 3 [Liparis tanakae]
MQEIVVSRGKILELLRPDANTGKVHTLLTVEAFGIVRSLMAFRLTGGTKDYIVVGSDSGRIVILEYHPSKNMFEKIHQETFGKSGCRRIVPGQFLAVDPKGRAVMIGAIEKQKLVYILNRDAAARLTISSPLEAHKANTLVYHVVGVDVGFENPMFACLEMDYEEADNDPTGEAAANTQQTLTFYELDLGLNHVVRKYSEALEEHGNFLITVPGGSDGPSGVLICSENYITYKNFGDQPDIRCPIPRRRNDLDDPERGMIFVCSATHKTKSMFFFLAQTEQGDIFKVTLETDEEMVTEIRLKYFDTIPVATAMCVLKTGFLFVCSEFGNHYLYQIAHLGDDDEEPEFSSAMPLEEGDTFFFQPRPLKNLVLVDEQENLSPIMSCQSGQLNEYTERKEMSADVVCMSLANVPPGEQRSRFLAVGLVDNTVRIISLDPLDCLQPLSMQALPAQPESLCIVEMGGVEKQDELGEKGSIGFLYLNIGLQNGVLLRTVLDPVTGDLSDTRTRYLGSRPVKLFRVRMQGQEAVLAMSSRSWLSYSYQSRFHLTPLSYETLEYASGFASEQCPEGIVAISTNTLRILALEKLGAVFNQVAFPLQYTPRKFVIHPETNNLIVIETDHNAYTEATKAQRKQQMAEEMVEAAGEDERELAAEMAAAFLNENLPEAIFGAPKAGAGQWASLVRLINPIQGTTLDQVQLEQNEAAFSVAVCRFPNTGDDWYVLVGVAKDMVLNPRSVSGGFIYTYRLISGGEKLEFVHKTPVEDVPLAIAPFQGRVLVGVGKLLRIYDLGKKKLLRKCENKHVPNLVTSIHTIGQRVIVTDVQESLFWVRYRRHENQLIIFADDTYPRWVRLPANTSDDVDEDPTGNKALWDRGLLNGASQKAEVIVNYHVGETVLSLQKTTLIPGGSESMVYTTLSGGIGILVPFTSHEDHDFFQHLEMHMRSEFPPLCGRDHLSFRSYYFPVKNVIDGDLCEQFNSMDPHKQKSVAEELDRTPPEVSKKLEDIRTRYAF